MAEDRIDTRDLVDELAALLASDEDLEEDDALRVSSIQELFDEISDYAGDRPEDGVFLIREDMFEDYARELADDIGAIDGDAGWPQSYIDWGAAADALAMDYTTVDFDGATYYYR